MIVLLQGCSSMNNISYNILQATARQECTKIINPEERQQCINEHSQAYDPNKYQKTNQ